MYFVCDLVCKNVKESVEIKYINIEGFFLQDIFQNIDGINSGGYWVFNIKYEYLSLILVFRE